MRQSTQEAALLEASDQAMDTRLRLQPERLLHLVERWRDAVVVEALVDEHQQLVLFTGQHRLSPRNAYQISEQILKPATCSSLVPAPGQVIQGKAGMTLRFNIRRGEQKGR